MRRVSSPCVQRTGGLLARLVPIVAATIFSCVAGLSPGQTAKDAAPSKPDSDQTVVIRILGPDGQPLSGVLSQTWTGKGPATESSSKTGEATVPAPPQGK